LVEPPGPDETFGPGVHNRQMRGGSLNDSTISVVTFSTRADISWQLPFANLAASNACPDQGDCDVGSRLPIRVTDE
jgi:hypothetical protein